MANHQLRLGVVGCGWAGRQAVLAASAVPRTIPVAVADVDMERCTSVANEFSVPGIYQHYEDLLQDPAVDAVYLATPPDKRLSQVLRVLAAGKDVLVQKPHAIHAAEILEMDRAARQHGKTLQFCYFKRHNPKYRQIRQAVQNGKIGEPYHARVFVKFNHIPPLDGYNRWLHVYGKKGGALGQHASHEFDLVWWWMGRPKPEWAFGVKHTVAPLYTGPEGAAEDYFSGLVGFAGGKTIQIDCSRMVHSNAPNIVELYGTTGAITEDKISRTSGGEFAVEEIDEAVDIEHTVAPDNTIYFYYEIEHFAMAAAGKVAPDVSAADAYIFMQMLDALYESAQRQTKICIEA